MYSMLVIPPHKVGLLPHRLTREAQVLYQVHEPVIEACLGIALHIYVIKCI